MTGSNRYWEHEVYSYIQRGFMLRAQGADLYVYDRKGKLLLIHRGAVEKWQPI